MSERKRYAIVGTGNRCGMFLNAIARDYTQHAELVGLCDLSQTRMDWWNNHLRDKHGHNAVPTFVADQFDQMIAQTKPETVIVTTVDAEHHRYIIRAMELGCDAVSEKPMTTDEAKARGIFQAIKTTGRHLRVTFNYRYQPAFSKLREIVAGGEIGTPRLVDFQWRLDTAHGANYFRRWHREKHRSGGLLVHKSTHHFDLVNFWLNDFPETVFALGDLAFYGQKNAEARGEHYDYERYAGQATPQTDPFAISINGEQGNGDSQLPGLYYNAEHDHDDGSGSGYIRDRNVFGGEDKWPITSEDTMTVTARYRRGTILSYSLIAYCPWEGERVTITGDQGTVEYSSRGRGHILEDHNQADPNLDRYQGEKYIRLQKMFQAPQEIEIPHASGGHGGGDKRILDRIFLPDAPEDPLGRDASHIDGAASILTGVAANRSIETGQPVSLTQLMPLPDPAEKPEVMFSG